MAVIGGSIAEGDLVTTTPSSQACGRCWYCLHQPQRPALCANRYVHGFVSSEVAPAPRGGFAEYMHLTRRSWIFKIPEGLSAEIAVLTEPAAVATRAVERTLAPGIPHISEGLGMDKSVIVLGAGPIGQLVIAALAHVGTDCIIASDLSPSRLTLAEAMGAHHTIAADASLDERLEQVKELTHGVGPDVVIETAGVPVVFKESLDFVRRGGIVVEVGHFTDPRRRRDPPEPGLLQGPRHPRHVGLPGHAVQDRPLLPQEHPRSPGPLHHPHPGPGRDREGHRGDGQRGLDEGGGGPIVHGLAV